ncbi:conserved hypothetical protein [Ricinus communis]|uniref:Uncharacterized protein n=1 Tax=Ricinus communis TaxID=3988 RepID=B9SBA7_RICCO|nr:conserved hypothetical protein [Ricinus communis]
MAMKPICDYNFPSERIGEYDISFEAAFALGHTLSWPAKPVGVVVHSFPGPSNSILVGRLPRDMAMKPICDYSFLSEGIRKYDISFEAERNSQTKPVVWSISKILSIGKLETDNQGPDLTSTRGVHKEEHVGMPTPT